MEQISVRAKLVNKLLIVAVVILISFIISLQIAGVNFEQQTMMAIFIFALATSGALFYLHQTLDVLAAKLDLVESSLPYLKDNDQYGFDKLNQDAYPAFFRSVSDLFTIEVEEPEPDKLDIARLKALDVCQGNVMMADADCNITYVNTSVTAMLQKNETALRALLPNFNVATLVGTNVDVFHQNPSHQRSLLQSLRQSYSTKLELGDLTFSLIASPLFDEKGERLGTVVEWEDISDRLAAEKIAEDIANANQRTTSALDVCQANVMMADADYNIIYVNEAVKVMLSNNEQQLRTVLPNFNVANLIGTNIDTFHVNPAHQRTMLDNLKSTYKTNLELAGFTFGLIATPVFNDDGERLGTVVEWEDKTERLAAEKIAEDIANANQRTTSALDVCQANVMMADADLNIIYINGAVKAMLRSREKQLQELLPNFNVDNLIGTCVDDFHKNPAHQRGMLENLKSVYKTDLELGEMTFGLIATPVINDNGERLGTVVEWEDKTERLAAEKIAAEIANAN
ncbi:diguanylate cyclase, partial [Pseudoalteromonas sp. NBT06-2]|uniref:PAS domain-containing protein n=1 Tax=Pseudoalteromonas sp. NBT06-2 TaxID=2025950 RepID=UPI000BCE629F